MGRMYLEGHHQEEWRARPWGHEESRVRGQRETAETGRRSASGTCWDLPESLPGSQPSHRILEAINPMLFLSQTIYWLQPIPGSHWALWWCAAAVGIKAARGLWHLVGPQRLVIIISGVVVLEYYYFLNCQACVF